MHPFIDGEGGGSPGQEPDDEPATAYGPSTNIAWSWSLNLARAIGLAKLIYISPVDAIIAAYLALSREEEMHRQMEYKECRREDLKWRRNRDYEMERELQRSRSNKNPLASIAASEHETQANDLWWEAYAELWRSRQREYEIIKSETEKYLGFHYREEILLPQDGVVSTRLSGLFKRLPMSPIPASDNPVWREVEGTRRKIRRIVEVIDQQLGLHIATLAWSCVYIVLVVSIQILQPLLLIVIQSG
jgi:hypothetical protein